MRSLLKHIGIRVDSFEELFHSTKELAATIDRFDDLFAGLGWIAYRNMDSNALNAAAAKNESDDIDGAQTDLVRHYNTERITFELNRMRHIRAFQSRMPLATKALTDLPH